MIHISFCTSNLYAKFAGTSMLSVLENTSTPPRSVIVHILHDNSLTAENRDNFNYIAGMYNQCVNFYNVEVLCAQKIAELQKLWPSINDMPLPIVAFYRLFIPDLLDRTAEKVIYLDSDIIVNLDIAELWSVALGDEFLAAVSEKEIGNPVERTVPLCAAGIVKAEDYFNSGVLVMGLKKFLNEAETLKNSIRYVSESTLGIYMDQDVLNYAFSTRYLKLPTKFNTFTRCFSENDEATRRRIYHYSGGHLNLDLRSWLNRLWLKYLAKTPWFNGGALGRLGEGIRRLCAEQKDFAVQVSAMMAGKVRAFFVQPSMVDAMRQAFRIREDEELIVADSAESLQRMAQSMARGGKVFFVLLPVEFRTVQPILTRAGFVEGRDFVDAMKFLSDAHGVPLNTYSLIKLL